MSCCRRAARFFSVPPFPRITEIDARVHTLRVLLATNDWLTFLEPTGTWTGAGIPKSAGERQTAAVNVY